MTEKVALSKSDLWKLQEDFYQKKGIGAWDSVPFYSTSNPSVANGYANTIISFMQDCLGQSSTDQPFYIIELAAGTGTLSFYLLKRLRELQAIANVKDLKFVYVMTDVAVKNIDFWRTHPAFQDFVNKGILEFAEYAADKTQDITLSPSGKVLSAKTIGQHTDKPLIVLANYLFDTIAHDLFRTHKDTLQVALVNKGLTEDTSQLEQNQGATLNDLGADIEYQTIQTPYYQDERLDLILEDYRKNLKESNILFPIGALRCINHLMDVSNEKLLLISTDKGYARHIQTFGALDLSEIQFHAGCFSVMVNFNAIGQFFQNCGGQFFHQTQQHVLHTSAFVLGAQLETLPLTTKALLDHISVMNPADNHAIFEHVKRTKHMCSLETLITYFNITHWDTLLFDHCFDVIHQLLNRASPTEAIDIMAALDKIAGNFYYLPKSGATLSNLGLLYQAVAVYDKAIDFFQQYLDYFGSNDPVLFNTVNYNLGLCFYQTKENPSALTAFRAALHAQPEQDMMARGWIARIEEEMAIKTPDV